MFVPAHFVSRRQWKVAALWHGSVPSRPRTDGWLFFFHACALAAAPTWLQRCLRLGRGRIWICISWEKGCMRSRNGPFLLSFRSIFSLRPSFFRSAPSSFLPSWSGLAALGAWGSSLHCRHWRPHWRPKPRRTVCSPTRPNGAIGIQLPVTVFFFQ